MGDSMIYIVLPARLDLFGVSVTLAGVLLSANRVIRLASNQWAAWLIDRFGMGRPLLTAVVVAIGTTVAYGVAPWFVALLIARILWGITFSVFRLSGYLVLLGESADGNRGRLFGVFNSGMRSGSLIGVLLGGLLFDLTGRQASFLIIAGFGLAAIPAAIVLIGRGATTRAVPEASNTSSPETNVSSDIATDTPGRSIGQRVTDVLISSAPELRIHERRMILASSFTYFCLQLAMNGVLVSSLGYFLNQRIGTEAAIAGVVVGVASINAVMTSTRWFAGLAGPLFGHVSDKFGRARILSVTLPVCITILLVLASPINLWLALIWLPVAFMATAAWVTALDSLVGGLAPSNRRAQIMSRYATWQDTGSAIGPLVAFAVLGYTSLSLVYLSGAALLVIALIVFLLVIRSYFKGQNSQV